MQVYVDDVDGHPPHQDDEEDGFVFLQAEEDNQLMEAQQQQECLNSTYLYLESLSSFNQMHVAKYLDDVHKVWVMLRAKCNAGKVFSNKQGFLLDMFNM